jgi:hypothetical protein
MTFMRPTSVLLASLPVGLLLCGAIGAFAGCSLSPYSSGTNDPLLDASTFGGDPDSSALSFDGGTEFADAAPIAPRPTFPPTTTASVRPPPISGGTLLVTANGAQAIVADPDRNAIYGVSVAQQQLAFTVALQPGDEPGRLAEDGAQRVHVALRGGGALVTLDERPARLSSDAPCARPHAAWRGTRRPTSCGSRVQPASSWPSRPRAAPRCSPSRSSATCAT